MEAKTGRKGLAGLGFSILFILLGVYLLTKENNTTDLDPLLVKGLGVACIGFFGAVVVRRVVRGAK